MGIEKRQFDRREHAMPLRIEVDSETFEATTTNISLGGARVEVPRTFPFGTKVKVRIRLPALTEESVLDAQVRWSQAAPDGKFFVGLQFQRVRARETWALNQLIRGT